MRGRQAQHAWLVSLLLLWALLSGQPAAGRVAKRLPRIAILTVAVMPKHHDPSQYSGLRMNWASLVNKYSYAEAHGYAFLPVLSTQHTELAGSWIKIPALLDHLPEYEWIWALDLDAWITNSSLAIEDHILAKLSNPKVDIIIAKDCNGINCGSFFLRRSLWTLSLLNQMWDMRHKPEAEVPAIGVWWEQAALMQLLRVMDPAEEQRHVAYLSPADMNAYPEWVRCGAAWQPDSFVLHLAGIGYGDKINIVSRLTPQLLPPAGRRAAKAMRFRTLRARARQRL